MSNSMKNIDFTKYLNSNSDKGLFKNLDVKFDSDKIIGLISNILKEDIWTILLKILRLIIELSNSISDYMKTDDAKIF